MARKKSKHSLVRYVFDASHIQEIEQPTAPLDVWNLINNENTEFKFGFPKKGKSILIKLIGAEQTELLYSDEDTFAANRRIRELLVEKLRDNDPEIRILTALWIVRYWGRIPKNSKKVRYWVGEFGNYDDSNIHEFISRNGTSRISSWSKILAFSDLERYAILDSNVAVAINIALLQLGRNFFFYMPTPRPGEISDTIKAVRNQINLIVKQNRHRYRKYNEYLDFLRAIKNSVNAGRAITDQLDLLDIEMSIFSNTDRLAEDFLRGE